MRASAAAMLRAKATAASTLGMVALVASACGQVAKLDELPPPTRDAGPSTRDAGPPPSTCPPLVREPGVPRDACDDFVEAHAVFAKACLGYDACQSSVVQSCRELLALPGTSLTTADIVACSAAVKNGTATCALPSCSGYGGRLVAPIEPRPGSLPSGSACLVDHQCATGECHFEYGKSCGTCLKTRFIHESCNPPTEPCLGGMNCIDGVCEDGGKKLGEACDPSMICAWDLYCDAGSSGLGVCAQRRENGERCTKSDECMNRHCDAMKRTCVGHPSIGTRCDEPAEAPCGWDGVMMCSSGVCEWMPVYEGGDCSEAPCSQNMKCIDDVCRKPAGTGLAQGERCYETYCAAGLTCTYVPCESGPSDCQDRICLPMQPGDRCNESCSPGAVCDGKRCQRRGDRGDVCWNDPSSCLDHLACVDGKCAGYEASRCR